MVVDEKSIIPIYTRSARARRIIITPFGSTANRLAQAALPDLAARQRHEALGCVVLALPPSSPRRLASEG